MMPDGEFVGRGQGRNPGLPIAEEKLDRVLVAGLILEVVLDSPGLPAESPQRRYLVKSRVQHALLSHLAGRVTLQRFREFARQLDRWFPYFYPRITGSELGIKENFPLSPPLPSPWRALKEDLLAQWIYQNFYLFPRRRHRKLHQGGLLDFLRLRQGGPFRVKDFQEFFRMDRKTAWEYLQKFREAGLLAHNQRCSAAVRYCLAPQFLAV